MPGPYNLFTGGRFGLGVESWDTFLIIEDICPPLHLLLETRLPYILGRVENLIIYIVFHWIALVPSFIFFPTLQMLNLMLPCSLWKNDHPHHIVWDLVGVHKMEGKVLEPETTRRDDWIPLLSPPPTPNPRLNLAWWRCTCGWGEREEAVEETEELY